MGAFDSVGLGARRSRRARRSRLGQYDDEGDAEEEALPEDYTITPCGRLGGKSCVGQVEGKFLGEFDDDEKALAAICEKMDKEQFWPGVWLVSDHGNWTQIDPKCSKRWWPSKIENAKKRKAARRK